MSSVEGNTNKHVTFSSETTYIDGKSSKIGKMGGHRTKIQSDSNKTSTVAEQTLSNSSHSKAEETQPLSKYIIQTTSSEGTHRRPAPKRSDSASLSKESPILGNTTAEDIPLPSSPPPLENDEDPPLPSSPPPPIPPQTKEAPPVPERRDSLNPSLLKHNQSLSQSPKDKAPPLPTQAKPNEKDIENKSNFQKASLPTNLKKETFVGRNRPQTSWILAKKNVNNTTRQMFAGMTKPPMNQAPPIPPQTGLQAPTRTAPLSPWKTINKSEGRERKDITQSHSKERLQLVRDKSLSENQRVNVNGLPNAGEKRPVSTMRADQLISQKPDKKKRVSDVKVYDQALRSGPEKRRKMAVRIGAKIGDSAGFQNGDLETNGWGQGANNRDKVKAYITENYLNKTDPNRYLPNIIKNKQTKYSDDTIFSDMTQYILDKHGPDATEEAILESCASYYTTFGDDDAKNERGGVFDRAHGNSMKASLNALKEGSSSQWRTVPYNSKQTGCGAAMRTMPMGLNSDGTPRKNTVDQNNPKDSEYRNLVGLAVGNGYITHQSPLGFLGAVPSALFTALAADDVPFAEWPIKLQHETQPDGTAWNAAKGFVNFSSEEDKDKYVEQWNDFNASWINYGNQRFPEGNFQVDETGVRADTYEGRQEMNLINALNEKYEIREGAIIGDRAMDGVWPGKSGHDAPIIAYDSMMLGISKLLQENKQFFENSGYNTNLAALKPSELREMLLVLHQSNPDAAAKLPEDLIVRACAHAGDSDSTGALTMAWMGAAVDQYALPRDFVVKQDGTALLEQSSWWTDK